MAQEFPVATQNDVPEGRIVMCLLGAQGYILQILGVPFSALAANKRTIRIPFTGDKELKSQPGYAPVSLTPQIGASDYIVTSATRTSDNKKGAFRKGSFAAFTDQSRSNIGAFRHSYVDGLENKTRILAVTNAGVVYDADTGTVLTTGGDTVQGAVGANPEVLTYAVSPDGRALILEFSIWPENFLARHVFRLDVDYMADPQVTAAKIPGAGFDVDTTIYGTLEEGGEQVGTDGPEPDLSVVVTSYSERNATYPVTYGVDSNGDTAVITLTESHRVDTLNDFSQEAVSPGTMALHRELTTTTVWEVTINLPGGASKNFAMQDLLREAVSDFEINNIVDPDEWEASGTASETRVEAVLGVIWADPSIPALIYEYNKADLSVSGGGAVSGTGTPPEPIPVAGTAGTLTYTREVGIMIGDVVRALFTDTSSPIAATSGTIYPQEIEFAGVGVSAIFLSWPQGGTITSDPTFTNVTSNGFRKKLKWVTDPSLGSSFARSGIVMRDVSNLTGGAANNNRYWIDVKNADDWVFGVIKKRDLDGNTINTFDLYAGSLDETLLRQRYIDYLLAAAQAADTPDEDLIAALQGGGFGDFEIKLSNASRLAMR